MPHTRLAAAIATALLLSACNSGGGDTANATDFNLSGTVPGTLIEAFCDDGGYHATSSAPDGTNRHPYSLTLPMGVTCRLVMTTNEDDPAERVVTPIRFVDGNGRGGIAFTSSGEDIDLGHVALAMSRAGMRADANGDGVEDLPLDVSVGDKPLRITDNADDPLDRDGDGILNLYEDEDGDGLPNRFDDDDDGDGVADQDDDDYRNDSDGDGISNDLDTDDDNDGRPDDEDPDDDNDGVRDEDEDEQESGDNDEDGDEGSDDGDGGVTGDVDATTPSLGRLLASQCAQCHGPDGLSVSGIESLRGESAGELAEETREQQREDDGIMHFQALGYSDEEIQLIADWFAGLPGGGND